MWDLKFLDTVMFSGPGMGAGSDGQKGKCLHPIFCQQSQ